VIDNEGGNGQPQDRSSRVHGAVDAEALAPLLFTDRIGHQSITGRAADALAHAVAEAHGQRRAPAAGDIHEGFNDGGKAVAEHGQQLAFLDAVADTSAEDAENGVEALGQPADKPDDQRAGAEDVHDKEGHDGENHLGGDIGEEADQS